MLSRIALRRVAVVWVVLLIIASLQPARPVNIHGISFRHRALHVLVFAATAIVLLSLGRGPKDEWIGMGGVVCLATAIETAQYLIYHLPAIEWWDIREDSIGALLGLVLLRLTRVRSLLLADPGV